MGRDTLPRDGDLDLTSFVALSSGIGLGATRAKSARPVVQAPVAVPATPTTAAAAPKRPGAVAGPVAAAPIYVGAAAFPPDVPKAKAAATAVDAGKRPRVPLGRRLFAWSLDLILVCSTLLTALLCAAVWSQAHDESTNGDWFALAPVQWLASFEAPAVVGGVYAIFLAYVLLFKLVAGKTLGEVLTRGRSLTR